MGSAPLRQPCRSCGRTGQTHQGRGLCGMCHRRHTRAGTLDLFPPLGPADRRRPLPVDRAAFDAYCDASWATLMADVRERERARRPLVLAAPADPPRGELRRNLAAASVAAD